MTVFSHVYSVFNFESFTVVAACEEYMYVRDDIACFLVVMCRYARAAQTPVCSEVCYSLSSTFSIAGLF